MEINGYKFVRTCDACPEQYDVFKGDIEVGWVRLRYGTLSAYYMGGLIYSREFDDEYDEFKGEFSSDEEREHCLEVIAKEIAWEDMRWSDGLD